MVATAIGTYATTAALKALIGTTDSDDDSLLGTICDRVNQWVESLTLQPISPISSATYLYDGDGLRRVYLPIPTTAATKGIGGARAISLLEIAPTTGGTFGTIASTDYFVRGKDGVLGPFVWLVLSDLAAGDYRTFPKGLANIRVTMTAGWAAIPDDLTMTALNVAHRAWNARSTGNQSGAGNGEEGQPISIFATREDVRLVRTYKARPIP